MHGGALAHLSERGVRVTLVCATDGEAGKAHPSVGPVEDLGATRVEELKLSCARLGIEAPVRLGDARRAHARDDAHDLTQRGVGAHRRAHAQPLADGPRAGEEAACERLIHRDDGSTTRNVVGTHRRPRTRRIPIASK
ncbi:PIG-L family deacetylase [Gemmatirosa kalamazoonensis]|uniref:PIG-L family deacetylase n=1 Tax=Gemmatirosa kalamazoonensis TaxID=861299 RepID=UPI00046D3CCB|nr:PIG-L family deacetylase [Gemmatirosa kalamazoonensis]